MTASRDLRPHSFGNPSSRLFFNAFVMPWLDHGIHAVAFPNGTD
ncbi:hypothetical protein [Pannonibacter sp. SL95]|nr:hypothetical protein [Pannonibacter sp. SL95]MCY1707555.1 hypothetical protein [Pannonibacter sp. SL95]MCY1707557.1 hypothetical protein [Pannonibacter sp. SL95]